MDSTNDNIKVKKPRKPRIDLSENEKRNLHIRYEQLRRKWLAENPEKHFTDSWIWRHVQMELLAPERQQEEGAFSRLRVEHADLLMKGELDDVDDLVLEPHNHRPLAERRFVKKESLVEMPPADEVEARSSAPLPPADPPAATQPPAIVPPKVEPRPVAKVQPPRVTPRPPVIIVPPRVEAPAPTVSPLETALLTLVRQAVSQIVKEELLPAVYDLIAKQGTAMDAKFSELQHRLLTYWDPELDEDDQDDSEGNVIQLPEKPKKFKVLISGGKDDGFWKWLPDVLPECLFTFCDGKNPRSIPTGKTFDLVIVHWTTGHAAKGVLQTYYPGFRFMPRGGHSAIVSLIREGLDLPPQEQSVHSA